MVSYIKIKFYGLIREKLSDTFFYTFKSSCYDNLFANKML